MPFTPPWVADAIFYQIFPDRFSNGDRSNDPAGTEEWGAKPTPRNFFGGDLRGIIERLPYLKDLGITAIYLNPIFTAGSNHKYNAADYQSIDPSFGSNDIFKEFLRICHTESIRVVIDGVFNHTGTDHRAFKDVKARGAVSSYAGWYNIFSYPVQPPSKPNYECWWNYGSLPRLMVQNPDVRNHLFEITRYWTELGVDGWRLDVANEIPHAFWKDWRKLVKSINPDCYITGEIWTDASAWLQGDEFDAVMNYRFREACLDYFVRGTISGTAFVAALNHVRSTAPEESAFAMQNLLGSHDTERILTFCRDDVGTERLAVLMQMTYVGAPMVYYGDEIGMTGGKDPDCRRTMIWDESRWNTELRTYYKKLIMIRKEREELRQGSFDILTADNGRGFLAFSRTMKEQSAIVAFNVSSDTFTTALPISFDSTVVKDALSGRQYMVHKHTIDLTLAPRSGTVLLCS